MNPSRRERSKKRGTLAWLAELYFEKGAEGARQAFASFAPAEEVRPYGIVRAGQSRPTVRTDVQRADGIAYESYNPPGWDQPYSLLRVRFEPWPKKDFIYHGGEELLVPLAGQVAYHFFWSGGGQAPRPEQIDPALAPGAVIRINPQIPHHTWAVGEPAEAWMIFRHLSETSAAISLDAPIADLGGVQAPPRRVSRQDLADPGRYALIAWGVAERLRLERERANLRVAQLAHACEIDPSHLSRIENADTNVSLDTLIRLARFLRIPLAEVSSPPARCREVGALPPARRRKSGSGRQPVAGGRDFGPHLIHLVAWDAPAGVPLGLADATPPGSRSSWIVLDGRVIFEIPGPTGEVTPELLEAGSVIHFRQGAPASVNAMQDSRLLQIVCSVQCLCG